MSLRAKLEAVIYAAEEPVTLPQLAGLFADEALAWKADQAAVAAAAQAAAQPATLPMIDEGLEYLGLEQTQAFYAAPEQADENPPVAEAESSSEGEPASADPAETVDAESEAKRAARTRDREVKAVLRQLLDEIMASYAGDERGIEIREIAGGYRMATKPECHDAVRMLIKSLKPPLKLSLPALETLAVIAYKQPVTAPEVNEIRGVESGGVLGSLLSRKLITTAGRKQVIGRPILYKTTKEFLLRFGLKDVSELPSMEEFEKMAAIELDDSATETEEASEAADGGPELDENASEEGADDAIALGATDEVAQAESTNANAGDHAPADASNEHAVVETAPHD
jgi:segregation and condensation protein B